MRLKSEIWVAALIRRANAGGAQAALVNRGDRDGGGIFIRINYLNGRSSLLTSMTDMDGARSWHAVGALKLTDEVVDGMITRELARDPDAWVVEIESRDGQHFIDEKLVL